MDDFRVLKGHALTGSQMQALNIKKHEIPSSQTYLGDVWYACITPNDGVQDGNATCSNNITIEGVPITVDNLILNATSTGNYTTDNLTLNYTLTNANNSIINWFKNGQSITILNMPFEATGNESTWTKDYSNNSIYATVTDATWDANSGHDGTGGYSFDGSNDKIELSYNDALNFLSRDFTINFWLKPTSANMGTVFASTTDNWFGIMFSFSTVDNIGIWASSDGSSWDIISGETAGKGTEVLDLNQWNHVVVTRKYERFKTYINGVKDVDVYASGEIISKEESRRIGEWGNAGFDLQAYLDDYRIYNISLTEDQIVLFHNKSKNVLAASQTVNGETWSACIAPHDGTEDGMTSCSNELTVTGPQSIPSIDNVTLNTISSNNYSTDNLTLNYTSTNTNLAIVNWFRNGSSLTILNMPFESTAGNESIWTQDYSNSSIYATVTGATWINDEGYDGNGVYYFDGSNDKIELSYNDAFDFSNRDFTINFWLKPTSANMGTVFASTTDHWFGVMYSISAVDNINLWASSDGSNWNILTGGTGLGYFREILHMKQNLFHHHQYKI